MADTKLPPDIAGQAELAREHILRILRAAGVGAEDIPGYVKARAKALGDARPAFLLLVVPQLIWPEVLVEVEVIAAKASKGPCKTTPSLRVQRKASQVRVNASCGGRGS